MTTYVRVALPQDTWRKFNEGLPLPKAQTETLTLAEYAARFTKERAVALAELLREEDDVTMFRGIPIKTTDTILAARDEIERRELKAPPTGFQQGLALLNQIK